VKDIGDEVENMRDELRRTVQDAQNKGKAGVNGDMLPDPDSFEDEDGYQQFEQERQMEIMNEQDEQLDGVFRTVGNLRQQADDMGRELGEQGELLDDVDKIADRVGGKLQTGLKKVGVIIKQNEGKYHMQLYIRRIANCASSRSLVQLLYSSADFCPHPPPGSASYTLSGRRVQRSISPTADMILV
jgi:hypothetical protein